MAILNFDKSELTNLNYSLNREFISTNRAGGYMSTTVVGCNTRKYHGLMVCPIENFETQNFVLLSSLDETIIQRDHQFNLAIHTFPDSVEPKGHKYVTNFDYTPTPTITYRVGGVVMKKEMLWMHNSQQLLIRYTLLEAKSPTTLRLRPFLAYRQTHMLSKVNMDADGKSYSVNGGVKNCMYSNFPYIYMQLNCENNFYAAPDWYYDFHYSKESERGYDSTEDLLTTGVFEIDFTKNKSVIISCSLSEERVESLEDKFNSELERRSEKTEFLSCLKHSARQFIVKQAGEIKLIAGYPWFERRGRDTMIATPWVTLTQNNSADCMAILKTAVNNMRNGLLRCFIGQYESADTSLWFFNALQQTSKVVGESAIWNEFGEVMTSLINTYANDLQYMGIELHDNGLIWASKPNTALTWMDMKVGGVPVTQRAGYTVEVNAMWYNALCYTLDMAKKFNDSEFVSKWDGYPSKIKESFNQMFWLDKQRYYADYVGEYGKNCQIRPNQLIALSLPYKMADADQTKMVLDIVNRYLLTTKGIRTLAPDDSDYVGEYGGGDDQRASAHHQGSTRIWLLPYYFIANFAIYGDGFLAKAKGIVADLEQELLIDYGIGTLAELYDGNPPHNPGGAVSQAISVGAVLRCIDMINNR